MLLWMRCGIDLSISIIFISRKTFSFTHTPVNQFACSSNGSWKRQCSVISWTQNICRIHRPNAVIPIIMRCSMLDCWKKVKINRTSTTTLKLSWRTARLSTKRPKRLRTDSRSLFTAIDEGLIWKGIVLCRCHKFYQNCVSLSLFISL